MRTCIVYCLLLAFFLSCKKDRVTPNPVITFFTPDKGAYNITVAIHGKNFDSLINSTSVTFNGLGAHVINVSDTLIYARVPVNATTGKIAVTVESRTGISSNDFIILPGTWTLKKNPVAPDYENRFKPVSFVIGNKAYVGLGFNGGTSIKDLWEYDPATNNWTRKADCGVDTDGGIAMVINGKAYVGFGRSHNIACCDPHKQIWEYDPLTNTWTRKADFPGQGRWAPFGIGVNGKGYMGMGTVANGVPVYDWWEYNPSTDIWTQKTNIPSTAYHYASTGFVFNNKIYVGTSAYDLGKDWFEYDPSTSTWTRKANFPGIVYWAASAFVIGNKGYVVAGGSECWEYDPLLNSWSQKAFFDYRYAGSAFSINNKGYYMGGSYYNNDMWEFTPQ